MTDFTALVHVRTLPKSEAKTDGVLGGYVWMLGRYPSEWDFRAQVAQHLDGLGYVVAEVEGIQILTDSRALNEELAPLHGKLDLYPLQYRNFHMYRNDDA